MTDDHAVRVRGAMKHFGRSSRRTIVLNGLDMTVPKGSIYALLGASGCGKTTLLSCIVGQQKLNSGDIIVLGGKPGSNHSGVPGPRVGFMPQELALMSMFTIKETIFYFGWLFGMNNKTLQEQYKYLVKLLQLPQGNQMVQHLSGGQQRRVSIAAALVHGAELLIMDEPTVGLDPMLREVIWKHLVTMAHDKKITVIITTHYIEEARQANLTGLMRQGRLLAEDSPDKLMIQYNCPSLEAVFLKLSIQQTEACNTTEISHVEEDLRIGSVHVETSPLQPAEIPNNDFSNGNDINLWSQSDWREHQPPFLYRMKPLIIKNLLSILRCNGELIQSLVMPVLILSLFYFCVGRYPTDLKFAVVNEELGNYTDCDEFMRQRYVGVTVLDRDTCMLSSVSCLFLSYVNDSVGTKVYYPDQQSALEAVNDKSAFGMLYFAANFSKDLQNREQKGRDSSNTTLEGSEVHITLDPNDPQIYQLLQLKLIEVYRSFAHNLSTSCNRSIRAAEVPLQFQDPVYGIKNPSMQSYIAPRALLLVVFLISTTVTSGTIVNDRVSGVWGRNIVAGVSLSEILASHVLLQMVLAFLYSLESSISIFLIFGEKCNGDVVTMFILVYLQSVCGICFGLAISVISKNYIVSTFLTIGSFIPLFIFCGLVWPIEGMHFLLTFLSPFMPTTISSLSLNHILQRGWTFVRPGVYSGFLITFAWMFIFLLFSLVVLRIRG